MLGIRKHHFAVENLKNIVQMFAFIAAGLYFSYQAALGFNWLTVSIDLTTERVRDPGNDANDIIAITLDLKNGRNGAFRLVDHIAVVRYGSTVLPPVSFSGTMRLNYKDAKLIAGQAHPDNPYAGFGPSEDLVFSAWVSVPYDEVCTIDVALLCKRPWQDVSQALSSTVSLPFRSNGQPSSPD